MHFRNLELRYLRAFIVLVASVGGIAFSTVRPAFAGPNAGGVLILTEAPGIFGCFNGDTPERGGEEYCENLDISDCTEAVVSTTSTQPLVMHLVAAFRGSPRLAGVAFGIEYSSGVSLLAWQSCGDFELPGSNWPNSGEGNAVTWSTAQTTLVTLVYWFAAYNYYGDPQTFQATPHPAHGGNFADDDVPSNIDPIIDYGIFGFETAGYAPCPEGGGNGACCFPDCSCQVLTVNDCIAAGGTYMGDGTTCEPMPCDCPPGGACCLQDGSCVFVSLEECVARGGDYIGDGVPCELVDCGPTPTLESSWGRIKATYR